MNEVIEVLRICSDSAMLVLIWLVQLIIYPAFRSIEPDVFAAWHRRYVRTIALVVIPLMLIQASCIVLQLMHAPNASLITSAGAVLTAWLVTFGISAPCHRKLQTAGRNEPMIQRLIATNWLRTAGWSLAWLMNLQAQISHG